MKFSVWSRNTEICDLGFTDYCHTVQLVSEFLWMILNNAAGRCSISWLIYIFNQLCSGLQLWTRWQKYQFESCILEFKYQSRDLDRKRISGSLVTAQQLATRRTVNIANSLAVWTPIGLQHCNQSYTTRLNSPSITFRWRASLQSTTV